MKRNDYKKLCKELNTDIGGWNDYELKAEYTGFFDGVHGVGAGRNRVGTLLDFHTKIIEADGIHIESSHDTSIIDVYIKSAVKSGHGFGRYEPTLFVYKGKDGKRRDFSLIKSWDREDGDVKSLKSAFGYDISEKYPEKFERFIERETEDSEDNVSSLHNAAVERDDYSLRREFTENFYKGIVYHLEYNNYESIKELFSDFGFKLYTVFKYTKQLSFSPDYVKHNGTTELEFGWTSTQTYNSLPYVLKFSKVKDIKTKSLSELGIEGRGYYSHDDRMTIRPEQVRAAKKFMNTFNETKSEVIQSVIEDAKKGA